MNELVSLMESPSLKVQCQATLALRNLASDEIYQLEIARHPQGLSRLLVLLHGKPVVTTVGGTSSATATTAAGHSQLTLAAVACIRNISIHPQNESRIIEAGFLKPLVDLLENESEEAQCHAISTLRNLAAGGGGFYAAGEDVDSSVATAASSLNKDRIMESGALEKIRLLIERATTTTRSSANGQLGLSWSVLSEMTACIAVLALSGRNLI